MVEFALNGLLVEAWHFGLIVAWASLYGLFNGLQARHLLRRLYLLLTNMAMAQPTVAAAPGCSPCQ